MIFELIDDLSWVCSNCHRMIHRQKPWLSIEELNAIIVEHEKIVGAMIDLAPVKKTLFPDYFGEVKSLGAWGGDFVLATGNEETPNYFKEKGYATVLGYHQIIL